MKGRWVFMARATPLDSQQQTVGLQAFSCLFGMNQTLSALWEGERGSKSKRTVCIPVFSHTCHA